MKRKHPALSLIFLSTFALLAGCTQAQPTPAPPTPTRLPLQTDTASVSARPSATATQTPKPTLTITATRQPTQTATNVPSIFQALLHATELPPLDDSGLTDLHGLILFRSEDAIPFTSRPVSEAEAGYITPLTRYCQETEHIGCLWAVSPDGQSFGLLSPRGFDFNLFVPPDGLPLFVENGFVTNRPPIQAVSLPVVCATGKNCDQILFSPDGRYLGFRYGPDNCGRAMQLIDLRTGATILQQDSRVHGFEFLDDRTMILARGHCEGGGLSFFDLASHQMVDGGGYGTRVWNPAGTLLVVNSCDYPGMPCQVWGYNALSRKTFISIRDKGLPYMDHVIFLPDGKRFLYQYLAIDVDQTDGRVSIPVNGQIVLYAPFLGTRIVLAADPAYHYRLCQFDRQQPCPIMWYGDWIQVQRVPVAPLKCHMPGMTSTRCCPVLPKARSVKHRPNPSR